MIKSYSDGLASRNTADSNYCILKETVGWDREYREVKNSGLDKCDGHARGS